MNPFPITSPKGDAAKAAAEAFGRAATLAARAAEVERSLRSDAAKLADLEEQRHALIVAAAREGETEAPGAAKLASDAAKLAASLERDDRPEQARTMRAAAQSARAEGADIVAANLPELLAEYEAQAAPVAEAASATQEMLLQQLRAVDEQNAGLERLVALVGRLSGQDVIATPTSDLRGSLDTFTAEPPRVNPAVLRWLADEDERAAA